MMKRKFLAVVIPALLIAGTANAAEVYNKDGNKLDLYGRAQGLHYFSKHDGSDGDRTYARLGFKGETEINDQLTGFGQWEYNIHGNYTESDGSSDDATRLAFAGLSAGDQGSFSYGRNYGLVYDVIAYTDMLPEFGGDTGYSDNFFAGRSSGLATYRNSGFFGLIDGLDFGVQYQGKNERDKYERDESTSNGDGWATSLSYTVDGFSVVGAYGAGDRTNLQQSDGNGEKAEQWYAGVKYDANNLYLAAIYGETHNATYQTDKISGALDKTQDFSVVAQYQFDFGLRPSLAYYKSRAKDVKGIAGDDEDFINYVEVGATYFFNKNMSTYFDYKINQLDDNNKLVSDTKDVFAVGMIYQF